MLQKRQYDLDNRLGGPGNHSPNCAAENIVRANLIVWGKLMFNFTERLVEGVASAYSSQIEAISKVRAEQLADIKSKIRTNPDEVEAWFDKEIARIGKIDVSDLFRKIKL